MEVTQSLPSLELVLEIARAERTLLANHFDSLDTKAGVVLGSAGVLIALSPDLGSWLSIASIVGSIFAATLAVATFWPRQQLSLMGDALKKYVQAEPVFTRVRILDSLAPILQDSRLLLQRKGLILKLAMVVLAIAGFMLAVDQILRWT